jgi:hypothetical protein
MTRIYTDQEGGLDRELQIVSREPETGKHKEHKGSKKSTKRFEEKPFLLDCGDLPGFWFLVSSFRF